MAPPGAGLVAKRVAAGLLGRNNQATKRIRVIDVCTVAGAIFLVVRSLWPGYAGGGWMCLLLPLIGGLAVAWFVVAVMRAVERQRPPSFPLRRLLFTPSIVVLTFALLLFYVPRRIAFWFVRGEFERHVASAVRSKSGGKPLGRIGIYAVDEYAADPRGGVYFRSGSQPSWGPDRVSYGFAYKPNKKGTPFGAAEYGVWPLGGGWYWFRASDD